jgi:hypothetical protein
MPSHDHGCHCEIDVGKESLRVRCADHVHAYVLKWSAQRTLPLWLWILAETLNPLSVHLGDQQIAL